MRAIRTLIQTLQYTKTNDVEFSVSALDKLETHLFEDSNRAAHIILNVKPDRIRTIICGFAIIKTLTEYTKTKNIQVSLYGLREGYLIEKILIFHILLLTTKSESMQSISSKIWRPIKFMANIVIFWPLQVA